jgi:hypothetical protein
VIPQAYAQSSSDTMHRCRAGRSRPPAIINMLSSVPRPARGEPRLWIEPNPRTDIRDCLVEVSFRRKMLVRGDKSRGVSAA